MRRFLAAVMCLGASAAAAATHVQSTCAAYPGNGSSIDVTLAQPAAAGNLLVLAVVIDGPAQTFDYIESTTPMVFSGGSDDTPGPERVAVFYSIAPAPVTRLSVYLGASLPSGTSGALFVHEYSGVSRWQGSVRATTLANSTVVATLAQDLEPGDLVFGVASASSAAVDSTTPNALLRSTCAGDVSFDVPVDSAAPVMVGATRGLPGSLGVGLVHFKPPRDAGDLPTLVQAKCVPASEQAGSAELQMPLSMTPGNVLMLSAYCGAAGVQFEGASFEDGTLLTGGAATDGGLSSRAFWGRIADAGMRSVRVHLSGNDGGLPVSIFAHEYTQVGRFLESRAANGVGFPSTGPVVTTQSNELLFVHGGFRSTLFATNSGAVTRLNCQNDLTADRITAAPGTYEVSFPTDIAGVEWSMTMLRFAPAGAEAGQDASVPDAGSLDSGVTDAGGLDGGGADAGTADAGHLDAGVTDGTKGSLAAEVRCACRVGSGDGLLLPLWVAAAAHRSRRRCGAARR